MNKVMAAVLFASTLAASPICNPEKLSLEAAIKRAEKAEMHVRALRKCITFIAMNPYGHCMMHRI